MGYSKWVGKCAACGEWNSVHEEKGEISKSTSFFGKEKKSSSKNASKLDLVNMSDVKTSVESRVLSNISEFDRVLGGGFVRGSAILIGGDPGIGKSTLLLQTVSQLSRSGLKCVYISGEESVSQIALRSERLGLDSPGVLVASSGCVEQILETLSAQEKVDYLVIDSIQTMYLNALESTPGSVAQIKACGYELINYCKTRGIIMVIVGHVTKDGQIAGPKLLEHMVDVMLYFEGENNNHFRILRGMKNRFGATNEVGIFEMTQNGISGVENPSQFFLSNTKEDVQGRVSFAAFEGTRAVLLEVESLTSPSFIPNPRRVAIGWDGNRLNMIIAILSSKCGLNFAEKDVYLSVLGGFKTQDPAADLAVALSLKSALFKEAIPSGTIAIGEVSLSGQVRNVFQMESRVKEAAKLGFRTIITPKLKTKPKLDEIKLIEVEDINEIIKRRLG